MGPPVELHEDATADASFAKMVGTVRMCVDSLDYEAENICLIAPKKAHLEQLQSMLKDTLALDGATVNSTDFDFAEPGIVRLSTMQSCKGLDFPVVLFYIDHRSRSLLEQLD
jgi:superfamily I DNA/RNA helicase